ncbi:DUF3105 domain-containing protein [Actinotalea ferrariae]|uniref:DUF3105 domain-containing protein n=1 Tax=Actinotalea ferrariae TaxID=1386098 RepID=UPI001C8CA07A|nr:DUF3105 domain-containing protein [Actinotalea ferrariae]MBX9243840.1 DUF3105 domain-containing protein [Actinotalea ferrariae]
MSKRQTEAAARAERLAQIRREQQKAERRRIAVITTASLVVAGVLVGATAIVLVGEQSRQADVEAAASGEIDGVQTYPGLTAAHVTTPVDYEQTPPVGGEHAGVWADCQTYTEPVPNELAVHSLEHGAVWITYDPELPEEDIETLRDAATGPYTLLSPFEGLPQPVVASAWGLQLALDDVEDPRLEQFIVKYEQGEQALEPGAPCTGGAAL